MGARRRQAARSALAAAALSLAAAPALAALAAPAAAADFTVSGSIGFADLEANEYLYDLEDNGTTVSRLIWQATAVPVATFEAEWQAAERLVVFGSLGLGLGRGGDMADYDWTVKGRPWSMRSQHPDTELDRYLVLELGARYDLLRGRGGRLGLAAGLSYTNVKWTARGGSYVYSSDTGFRDRAGAFADGAKVISYQQSLPAFYLGPAGAIEAWGLTLSGRVVGGLTLDGSSADHHWLRDLSFEQDYHPAPYLGLRARLELPIGPEAALFLGGRYRRHFLMKGSTLWDEAGAEPQRLDGEVGGASFGALTVDAGLRVRF